LKDDEFRAMGRARVTQFAATSDEKLLLIFIFRADFAFCAFQRSRFYKPDLLQSLSPGCSI
jgi:hypothetical protein